MKKKLRSLLFFLGYIVHHNSNSKVIYYHDVSKKYTEMGTNIDLIKHHIEIIKKYGYKIVPQITQKCHEVMLCFDDGWVGIYDYRDFFIQNKLYPTIFIAVSLIGSEGYLTIEQIKELSNLGFRFQAHSWSHMGLSSFDNAGLEKELKESKDWLENTFGYTFDSICFPQGKFSMNVKDLCLKYGYTRLYSSIPGGYYDLIKQSLICRNCAQDMSMNDFRWTLNGTSSLFRRKLIKQHFQL